MLYLEIIKHKFPDRIMFKDLGFFFFLIVMNSITTEIYKLRLYDGTSSIVFALFYFSISYLGQEYMLN